jgi:TRAP-type C4-dicarboxylate transport system permease small subunit
VSEQALEAGAPRGAPNAAIAWAMRLEKLLDTVLGLMLLAVALALVYQVFGRYVIGRAPGWTEEVARMLIAWIAMLGAATCLRDGGHIAVGALVNAMPAGLRTVLLAVRDLCILATAGVLGWAGARFASMNASQESAALEIPMSIPYSAMGVGAVLLAIMLILARLGGETPPVDSLSHID